VDVPPEGTVDPVPEATTAPEEFRTWNWSYPDELVVLE
jgi:hypothetical protein